jgi:hypothetical protein
MRLVAGRSFEWSTAAGMLDGQVLGRSVGVTKQTTFQTLFTFRLDFCGSISLGGFTTPGTNEGRWKRELKSTQFRVVKDKFKLTPHRSAFRLVSDVCRCCQLIKLGQMASWTHALRCWRCCSSDALLMQCSMAETILPFYIRRIGDFLGPLGLPSIFHSL